MKYLLLLLLLTGCTLPKGEIRSVTTSVFGLNVGYNPATQMPQVQLGFVRTTYQVVPIGTNGVVPKVNSSMSASQKLFSTQLDEDFETGDATVPQHPSLARLSVIARSTNSAFTNLFREQPQPLIKGD